MHHGIRPAFASFALAGLAGLGATTACDKNAEPTPPDLATAAPPNTPHNIPISASGDPKGGQRPSAGAQNAEAKLPKAGREPDWGLDPADPAKDYVSRYLKAAKRYGDKSGCVVVGSSTFADGKATVEARNDASGACGTPNELRDRFIVSVATDRMTLDPTLKQPPLAQWPDGSDPDGPPPRAVDIQDMRGWHAGLHEAFHALQLAPLRLQLYGRGTYAVVSIAGWHGPVMRGMSPGELAGPAKTLCDANDGSPLGVIAGLDRSTLLRVTCPGSAHFETL